MPRIEERAGLIAASDYQIKIFEAIEDAANQILAGDKPISIIVNATAGSGKCLGKNTPILLYDGTVKAVQDVRVNDLLMGPDSLPRTVLSTNSGNGPLYRVTPVKGDSWICNDVHVMTLVGTNNYRNEVRDISLKDFFYRTSHLICPDRDWKLLRTDIEFPFQPVPFEPYLIGLWIGDGTTNQASITNIDPEVISYLERVTPSMGCEAIVRNYAGRATRIDITIGRRGLKGHNKIHPLRRFLKSCYSNQIGKIIPECYIINAADYRLELLAGLIDSDGHNSGGCYEISTKWPGLAQQILFLARSLGFAAYLGKNKKVGEQEYRRISISGDLSLIPCQIPRKKISPRKQVKNVCHVGWSAEAIGNGEYFGFTIDGDGRFLLGDFTVTHNTTTLVASTKLIPDDLSVLFVAFSKKIADELSLRLPPGIPARTFHAFWLRQWSRYIRLRHNKSAEVNHFKVRNAVEKHMGLSRFNKNRRLLSATQIAQQKKKREQADDVVFLVEKAKMFGVVPRDYPNGNSVTGYEDNDFFWLHVLEYFNYEIDPKQLEETIDIAREILWEGLENETEIDFADMIYLPAVKGVNSETFQIVMVDETQDLCGLQRYLLSRMIASGGMIIAIGDRRQSIFAFRNADAESMDRIQEDFDCQSYPLSISYRCAKAIVAEAYEIYPEIEPAPNATMGSVERPENWKLEDFRPGHLIVCRNNAPTIALCYRLIRHRVKAKVLGRDIGENLLKLVRQCDEDNTLAEMIDNLRAWRDHQLVLIDRKNPDDERGKEQIRDKYACITELATGDEILNVEQLLALIDQMFTTFAEEKQAISSSRVTLSTIHRCKGLESDTVFILDPHLINPPWIRSNWQQIEEANIHFVGITRAKTRLIYINSDKIKS